MVRCYYLLNMRMHPDQNIKADAQIVVSGANGMLAREMKQARTVETLQVLTPFVTAGLVPPQGARTLLHFVFGHTQATQMQLQALEFQALAAGRPADAAADPPGESRGALDASFDRGVATILAGLAMQLEAPISSGGRSRRAHGR